MTKDEQAQPEPTEGQVEAACLAYMPTLHHLAQYVQQEMRERMRDALIASAMPLQERGEKS